jgi:hypothetical protein
MPVGDHETRNESLTVEVDHSGQSSAEGQDGPLVTDSLHSPRPHGDRGGYIASTAQRQDWAPAQDNIRWTFQILEIVGIECERDRRRDLLGEKAGPGGSVSADDRVYQSGSAGSADDAHGSRAPSAPFERRGPAFAKASQTFGRVFCRQESRLNWTELGGRCRVPFSDQGAPVGERG